MNYKSQTTWVKMVLTILTVISLTAITLSSCTKSNSSSNATAQFVGTWNGTATCSSGPATLTFTQASGNTVTIPGTVGAGSCQRSVTFTLTASGNALSGSGSYQDLCGNTITMAISGTISGGTLTFTLSGTGTGSSGTCVFTGTK